MRDTSDVKSCATAARPADRGSLVARSSRFAGNHEFFRLVDISRCRRTRRLRRRSPLRNPIVLAKRSSMRFALFRSVEYLCRAAVNGLYSLAWRGSLGECGSGTRIDFGVTLILPKNIRLGRNCYLARQTQLTTEHDGATLVIGDDAIVGPDARIDYTGGVRIGNQALISEGVRIYTHDHDTVDFDKVTASPLEIGDHVWLGARAIVLASVRRIGAGAVIGAGSIVTADVEPGAVTVGVPAKRVNAIGKVSNG